MFLKNKIAYLIASTLLVAVFLLPVTVQFLHSLEGHEKTVCSDSTTHIHEDVPECQICHFTVTTFNYDVISYPDFKTAPIALKIKNETTSSLFHAFTNTNYQLRAPPHSFS
ncbi:hypothetical protein INR76_11610 [Marixanthomonas sp. SCSIO 43207]|uniref:hypothetical protein n=1 Tax=Marixanthomonas sp. SCSIO 43207 TaxID=2779360 RepID=UPI001CA94D46|nr:hypothetical protein [Marixanthomonas sp. SCSIO 43207]UAB80750.1 hypothetical protein INR76_11610 [Marixanthomonas sp. SCSIO 43207]